MTLNFPNESRNFDPRRNCVCFWGYDSAIEISFFVEIGAIIRLCRGTKGGEFDILQAFDTVLATIHEAADRVYVQSKKTSYAYTLKAEHFS